MGRMGSKECVPRSLEGNSFVDIRKIVRSNGRWFLLTTVLNLWALVSEDYSSKKFVSVVKDK